VSSRLSATDRVRRMLAIVPWVAAHPDGVPIDEICERFDVDRARLVDDLDTARMVGVAPYTPDLMIEVVVEDDRVFIVLPMAFDRPFRLTPDEGLALLAAGSSLVAMAGEGDAGPLATALGKIAGLLHVDADDAVRIELGRADSETLTGLRTAIAEHRQVQLDYYSYGRDDHAVRVVDPARLWSDAGQWYLAGYCHLAADDRVFRLDRIHDLTVLDAVADGPTAGAPGPPGAAAPSYTARAADPRIVLDLAPGARWVVGQYPLDDATELDGGHVRVTLAVSARPWLERLLVRLGPDATVVEADPTLRDAGREAATRILARYLSDEPGRVPSPQ
jgi:proteasome accessory factor C